MFGPNKLVYDHIQAFRVVNQACDLDNFLKIARLCPTFLHMYVHRKMGLKYREGGTPRSRPCLSQ